MKKKDPVVRMIKIIVSTSDGRTESVIKAPDATMEMANAAYRAICAMCGLNIKTGETP
jgi:hypothetical protein